MKVKGLGWLGTRTSEHTAMVSFFKETLGLVPEIEEPGFAVFRLPNGDTIEVFAADDEYHQHFTTGPVVGFRVDDVGSHRPRWRLRASSSSARPSRLPTGIRGRTSERPTGTSTRS
jgi:hypothetical protein